MANLKRNRQFIDKLIDKTIDESLSWKYTGYNTHTTCFKGRTIDISGNSCTIISHVDGLPISYSFDDDKIEVLRFWITKEIHDWLSQVIA